MNESISKPSYHTTDDKIRTKEPTNDAGQLTGIDGRPSFCFGSDEPVDSRFVSFVLGLNFDSSRFQPLAVFLSDDK